MYLSSWKIIFFHHIKFQTDYRDNNSDGDDDDDDNKNINNKNIIRNVYKIV